MRRLCENTPGQVRGISRTPWEKSRKHFFQKPRLVKATIGVISVTISTMIQILPANRL